ncbi:MAG: chain-length determining protein, partial [Lactococcus lactis]|nr:chain-length determining protein [Lactococcus lactis]
GIGLAFVLEFLDTTVKDEQFITDELGWTNLGSIMEMTDEELKMEEEIPERENGRLSRRSRV